VIWVALIGAALWVNLVVLIVLNAIFGGEHSQDTRGE
jgi:hypothetical protein